MDLGINESFDPIGKAFVEQYYKLFDANRAQLGAFYRDHSMLTFEGDQLQGTKAITEKLQFLKFQTVQHVVTHADCQPTANFGILVHVIGQLKTDNDQPHSFSQTFILAQDAAKQYYCLNDVFRLSLHHG